MVFFLCPCFSELQSFFGPNRVFLHRPGIESASARFAMCFYCFFYGFLSVVDRGRLPPRDWPLQTAIQTGYWIRDVLFWGGTLVIGRGFFFFFFLFFLFEFCGLNDCCDGITRMPLSGYEAFWGESIRCNKTEAYFHTRHSLIGCRWIDGGLWMIWRRKKTTLLPKMEAAARNRFTSAISCRFEVTIALIFPATPQNWNEPIKSEITLLRLRRASKEDVFPEIR